MSDHAVRITKAMNDIVDLQRRLERLEKRMPDKYSRLPRLEVWNGILRIKLRPYPGSLERTRYYQIPVVEYKEHREWRPVEEKTIHIHTQPRPKFNEADCGHKVMSKLTTCSRCGKEWEETKVKLDE